MAVLTAHQMGSARLGTSRATSVANPQGECWDARGLYICDASALPTSTGETLARPSLRHPHVDKLLGALLKASSASDLNRLFPASSMTA